MQRICFLDLDGTICDFVAGALAHHSPGFPLSAWPPGEYDIAKVLGLPASDLWAGFGHSFWASLRWTPDGRDILALVESICGHATILPLTSPPWNVSSASGKYQWILEHLPSYRRQFLIGPAKHLLARPGAVLIDDSDENCRKFEDAGGRAVLVPRLWNRRHADAGIALEVVEADLLAAWRHGNGSKP